MKHVSKKFFSALLACALGAGAARAWADVKIDAANFPDANFRRWVKENATGGKDVLTDAQRAAVEEMDLGFSEIASLKGVEHFTALRDLVCWSNELTELDLSGNPALEMLRCHGNELTKLDLSKNPGLKGLFCDQNRLAALDLSWLPELYALQCRHNALTALDLSRNPALVELDCWGNEITALDLSKNTALVKLNCLENPIKELDLSKNKDLSEASLPETAAVTLPNGDKIDMKDFTPAKGKDGKLRLDLSKYAGKTGEVSAESEGEKEIDVKSAEGVHTFAPFDGKLTIPYELGEDAELDLIVFVQEEEEE